MSDGLVLRKGQRWEFVNATRETVTQYELEKLFEHFYGNFAYLRNLKTDGTARITQKWLYEGESRKPQSHWRLIEDVKGV